MRAAKEAVETVDEMLGKICTCLDSVGGEALIISDHGNCEQMYIGDTENPHTYHTLNPVPCILFATSANSTRPVGVLKLVDFGALERS